MTVSVFDQQTPTHAFASVAEGAGPCLPFCWDFLPIYITMTDEEIGIFQAACRASGILNIRPLRVGRKIHDRYGMNSQIDLSRQIRQKDTGINTSHQASSIGGNLGDDGENNGRKNPRIFRTEKPDQRHGRRKDGPKAA
jgi:hypothetical protein